VLAAGGSRDPAGKGHQPQERLWVWFARPLQPAPESRRFPLVEAAPDWDVGSGLVDQARLRTGFKASNDDWLHATPDLSAFLSPNGKNGVAVYDAKTDAIRLELRGLKDEVTTLAVNDTGKIAAAANGPSERVKYNYDQKTRQITKSTSGKDGPGEVIVWDLQQGDILGAYRGHTQPVSSLAISPDGSTVASASQKEKLLYLWDVATKQKRATISGQFGGLEYSTDGRQLMAVRARGDAVIFDAQTAQILHVVPNPPGGLGGHRLSADGLKVFRYGPKESRSIRSPLDPSQLQVVDVKTGKVDWVLEEPNGWILAIAAGPGRDQLTTVSANHIARVWDLSTGRTIRRHNYGESAIRRAFLSADGRRLGFVSNVGGEMRICDVAAIPILEE
jgi:WD40 repeat protein